MAGNVVGQLVVEMAANMARFESDMRQANRVSQDTMRQIAGNVDSGVGSIRRSLSATAGAIGVTFSAAGVIAFTRETVNAALAAEKLNMQFKAVTGSSTGAARELGYIKNLSRELGLDMQTTATAYGKFLASTRDTSIEGRAAQKVFEGVSAASTALGLSADETSGIFLALSQMMSKGKVQAEELTGQLGERLPGALKLAANGMGMTTAELMKQMQEGKIMSSDLLPKLAAELEKTYGKAAKEASEKGQAGINRFNNEVRETAAAIGNKLMPSVGNLTGALAELLRTMREGDWGFGNASANIGTLLPGQGTLGERFAIPGAGQGTSIAARNQRIEDRLRDAAAIKSNVDPQMARIAADRQAEQEAVNHRRAEKERYEAGKAEREKAAKEAEALAEQQRIAYNQGVQGYNRLIDALRANDPTLSETQRKIMAVNEEVAALSREHPEQTKDAERIGKLIVKELELADARKVENIQLKESIKLYEKLNEDVAGFGGNLNAPFGLPTLKRPAYDFSGKPLPGGKFSLTGPAESSFFGGKSAEVEETQAQKDELLQIEKRYQDEILGMKMGAASKGMEILKGAAGESKGLAIAALAGQKALSIAQILMNTEAAASAALLAPPVGLGPIAGQGLAAEIRAAGYLSAAMDFGSGVMEGVQISGRRAAGGPVSAGKTYLVGERGPELMTVGANGYVTPNERIGGNGGIVVNATIDARGADQGVEQKIRAGMQQAVEAAYHKVKRSMDRGGEMALASGRIR